MINKKLFFYWENRRDTYNPSMSVIIHIWKKKNKVQENRVCKRYNFWIKTILMILRLFLSKITTVNHSVYKIKNLQFYNKKKKVEKSEFFQKYRHVCGFQNINVSRIAFFSYMRKIQIHIFVDWEISFLFFLCFSYAKNF